MTTPDASGSLHEAFPSTHWTQIRAGEDPRARQAALETLARAYAGAIRGWIRAALGRSREDSRDLAQDFFVWAIESGFLSKADPERGRFRAFLKTALRSYVAHADERAAALKRGGAARVLAVEDEALDPPDPRATPDEVLDQAWKAEVVRAALDRTRAECERGGREVAWAAFRAWFLDEEEDLDHRALAERLSVTAVDVSNHIQRTKRLYRAHLRAVVLETVGSREDLDAELAWLVGPAVEEGA